MKWSPTKERVLRAMSRLNIVLYRWTGGVIGGRIAGGRVLLLTTIGRKSAVADFGFAELAARLLPTLERKAGRLIANGWPTGVEVSHAMVHGGPFPSTSDGRSTSVGTLAIERFLRPVCYQDFPDALLPAALKRDAPKRPRRVDGVYKTDGE